MNSKILLLNDWTTVDERRASIKIVVSKIGKDEDKKIITGHMAKGSGEKYEPTINWETGEVHCGCGSASQPGMLFCQHLIALFDVLCGQKRTEKYAKQFIDVLNTAKTYTSYKTSSDRISTGCDLIDRLLDDGFPRSTITFIVGPTKVGKTWLLSQTAIYSAMAGKNVLYIDTEKYYKEPKVFPRMCSYFKERFKDIFPDAEEKPINVNFLFPKDLKELAGYLGLYMVQSTHGGKPVATIYSNVGRKDTSTPVYGICQEKKIDLIILDSLTAPFKKTTIVSQNQAIPSRSDMINAICAKLEEIASDLGVAIIVTSHASRNFDFKVEGLLTGGNEMGDGMWGGATQMFYVKYLIQVEHIDTDDKENKMYEGRLAKYIVRRLWPALYPRYIIGELIQDYGWDAFRLEGVPMSEERDVKDLDKVGRKITEDEVVVEETEE